MPMDKALNYALLLLLIWGLNACLGDVISNDGGPEDYPAIRPVPWIFCFTNNPDKIQSRPRESVNHNFNVSSVEELRSFFNFSGPDELYMLEDNTRTGVIRGNLLLTSDEYLLDEPLVIDFNTSFNSRKSEINLVYTPGGVSQPGRAVLRCRQAKTALIIRGAYGVGILRGFGVNITDCTDTAVVVETLTQSEVENAFNRNMSVDRVPFVRLAGFNFINNSGIDGGALRVHGATLDLPDNEFHNNTAVRGAALMMMDQSTADRLAGNCFVYNRVTVRGGPNRGGAVHLERDTCSSWFQDNRFFGNIGARGGAMFIEGQTKRCRDQKPSRQISVVDPCPPVVEDVWQDGDCIPQFANAIRIPELTCGGNHAMYDGGALFINKGYEKDSSILQMSLGRLENNTAAGRGGAIYATVSSGFFIGVVQENIDVAGPNLTDNHAGLAGGAVYTASAGTGFTYIMRTRIEHNSVSPTASVGLPLPQDYFEENVGTRDLGSGGAITSVNMGSLWMFESAFFNNSAVTQGGAVHCIRCSMYQDHHTTYESNSAGSGGAVALSNIISVLELQNTTYRENRAVNTPTMEAGAPQTSTIKQYLQEVGKDGLDPDLLFRTCGMGGGGAVCAQAITTVVLDNVTLEANTAAFGGAVFFDTDRCDSEDSLCPMDLRGVVLSGNKATLGGDAFFFTNFTGQPQEVKDCLNPATISTCANVTLVGADAAGALYTRPTRLRVDVFTLGNLTANESGNISAIVANEERFNLKVQLLDETGSVVKYLDQPMVIKALPGPTNPQLNVRSPEVSVDGAGADVTGLSMYGNQTVQQIIIQGSIRDQVVVQDSRNIVIRTCRVGEVSVSLLCQSCRENTGGSYSFRPNNRQCDRCPENTNNCTTGNYFYPMHRDDLDSHGYWHSHPRSPQIHQCALKEGCILKEANVEQLRQIQDKLVDLLGIYDEQESLTAETRELIANYSRALCSPGHEGVFCGTCSEGWGRMRLSCKRCRNLISSWILFLLSLVIDVAILSVLIFLRLRKRRVAMEEARKLALGQALDLQPPGAPPGYVNPHAHIVLQGGEEVGSAGNDLLAHIDAGSDLLNGHLLSRSPHLTSRPGDIASPSFSNDGRGTDIRASRDQSSWRPVRYEGDASPVKPTGVDGKNQVNGIPQGFITTAAELRARRKAGSSGVPLPPSSPPSTASDPLEDQEYAITWWRSRPGGLLAQLVNPIAATVIEEAAPAIWEVVVVYVQMIYTLMRINTQWPGFALNFFDIISVTGSRMTWASVDCLMPEASPWTRAFYRVVINALTPVGVGLILVSYWVLLYFLRHRDALTSKRRFAFDVVIAVVAQVLLYYYSSVTTVLISLFSCTRGDVVRRIEPYPAYLKALGLYWSQEFSTRCWEGAHRRLALGLGIPGLMVFSIAMPVAMVLFLVFNRKRLWEVKFRFTFGMLYENYRRQYYWFSIINFLLLASLAVVVEVLRDKGGVVQLIAYMAIVTAFLCLQLHYFAYRSVLLNGLSCMTLYAALATAYLALVFESGWVNRNGQKAIVGVIVFGNTVVLVMLIIHFIASAVTYVSVFRENLWDFIYQRLPGLVRRRGSSTSDQVQMTSRIGGSQNQLAVIV